MLNRLKRLLTLCVAFFTLGFSMMIMVKANADTPEKTSATEKGSTLARTKVVPKSKQTQRKSSSQSSSQKAKPPQVATAKTPVPPAPKNRYSFPEPVLQSRASVMILRTRSGLGTTVIPRVLKNRTNGCEAHSAQASIKNGLKDRSEALPMLSNGSNSRCLASRAARMECSSPR